MKKKDGMRTNPQVKVKTMDDPMPPEEALYDALSYAQDVLERAQIPFVVLGSAAFQIYNNQPLQVHKIVIGVLERHAVKECTSMLPLIEPKITLLTDGWELRRHNVPVYIKVLNKLYPTILNPDVVFYKYDAWKVPNPFDKYWDGDHYDI